MNHAITVGGMLLFLAFVVGLSSAAFGLLMIFAGGMSDAPGLGDTYARNGCVLSVVGAALVAISVIGFFT
jgi:hypothetical protein